MQQPQCLVFAPFRLDRRDERLWCGHEAIPLSPKTFAVLCCLVPQAGQLVTKEALLAAVWPETVVSESVVTVAIRQLRRVLGDQAQPHALSKPCTVGGIGSSRHSAPRRPLAGRRQWESHASRRPRFAGHPRILSGETQHWPWRSGGRRHARARGRWASLPGKRVLAKPPWWLRL
jgi:hypothetical protein